MTQLNYQDKKMRITNILLNRLQVAEMTFKPGIPVTCGDKIVVVILGMAVDKWLNIHIMDTNGTWTKIQSSLMYGECIMDSILPHLNKMI